MVVDHFIFCCMIGRTPANIYFGNSSWRRLEDVLKTSFVFVFRRYLQNVLIKTNIFILVIHLQKTSSRRLTKNQYVPLDYISSRRLQDVFKTFSQDVFITSSKHLAKTSSRSFQKLFKTSCKDVFKASSRRFQDVSLS